jgi:hypothetical protein
MSTTLTADTLAMDTFSATMPLSAAGNGEAFTASSDFVVAYPTEGKLLLCVNSTYAGASTVLITAGDGLGSGVGTYTYATAQDGVYYLIMSSSRFKTLAAGAGTVNITFGTLNTGFIRAFNIP